jgi:hypothetical protein
MPVDAAPRGPPLPPEALYLSRIAVPPGDWVEPNQSVK